MDRYGSLAQSGEMIAHQAAPTELAAPAHGLAADGARLAAQGVALFQQRHLQTALREVQRRGNAGDPSADHSNMGWMLHTGPSVRCGLR